MSTTTKEADLSEAERHQARWQEILEEPALQDLPYSVETNERGQIVLSPHSARHARLQKAIQRKLDELLEKGEAFSEWPVATSGGTKQIDVVWASSTRQKEMQETGDPPTVAPEICVEVMSESNTAEEMEEKRQLYLKAGAEEIWVVGEGGEVRFFDGGGERETSELAGGFPGRLSE